MKPRELHYTLRFIAPAFLGDADQSGRWRTPPIKAQLRQWWRVAYAAEHGYWTDVAETRKAVDEMRKAVDEMREAEAALFGAAGDDKGTTGRSQVRLRLTRWDAGALQSWQGIDSQRVRHPEAERAGCNVGAQAYLGYGALNARGGTGFDEKRDRAIAADESAKLSVALTPEGDELGRARLETALHLMHLYGTLGGRSRNAWGSYQLEPVDGTPLWPDRLDARCVRPWQHALKLDWSHALGCDDKGPLVWATGARADWRAALVELAKLKIALRTELPQCGLELSAEHGDRQLYKRGEPAGIEHGAPRPRHWLAYPVTNHAVQGWGDARLPNTLRFKLRPTADGQVEGIVFHMPALPAPAFAPDRHRSDIERLWTDVHAHLDRRLRPADGRKAAR